VWRVLARSATTADERRRDPRLGRR
jgi:hypothetical protein